MCNPFYYGQKPKPEKKLNRTCNKTKVIADEKVCNACNEYRELKAEE